MEGAFGSDPLKSDYGSSSRISTALRQELDKKGLKGFKKGGKVKATGKAKVHKGEYVLKKEAAQKIGPKKLASMNRAPQHRAAADKKLLMKTRMPR
jgi:hypothetical protein